MSGTEDVTHVMRVDGIPYRVQPSDVRLFFQSHGSVDVQCVFNRRQHFTGTCFVTFSNSKSLSSATKSCNGQKWKASSRTMSCAKSTPEEMHGTIQEHKSVGKKDAYRTCHVAARPPPPPLSHILFLDGLYPSEKNDDIRHFFKIELAGIHRSLDGDKAFVEFKTPTEAQTAFDAAEDLRRKQNSTMRFFYYKIRFAPKSELEHALRRSRHRPRRSRSRSPPSSHRITTRRRSRSRSRSRSPHNKPAPPPPSDHDHDAYDPSNPDIEFIPKNTPSAPQLAVTDVTLPQTQLSKLLSGLIEHIKSQ